MMSPWASGMEFYQQRAIHTCRRSEFGPRLPNWMQGLPNKRRTEKYLNQNLRYLVGANSERGALMRRALACR